MWMNMLAIIELLPSVIDSQLRRDFGMTRFEYNALAMLSDSPDGSLPMSHLAILTNGSQSRLSHAVSKLQDKGWVLRAPSAMDKRSLVATLTEEGQSLLERVAPHHVAQVRRTVIDAIPAEKMKELSDLLKPIRVNLLDSR